MDPESDLVLSTEVTAWDPLCDECVTLPPGTRLQYVCLVKVPVLTLVPEYPTKSVSNKDLRRELKDKRLVDLLYELREQPKLQSDKTYLKYRLMSPREGFPEEVHIDSCYLKDLECIL